MSQGLLDMMNKEIIMRLLVCVAISSMILGGCSYLNQKLGLDDDNFLEEILEEHIEDQTGLDVDLSSQSPE